MQHDDNLAPGLMVVHGNQLEALRELAVTWMRRYPLAPLENEVILVQSNGIAQWLKLALAEHRSGGIAAAVQVELPARFLWTSYRAVLGSDSIPRQSPLDKAPLTWRLMRLLPGLLAEAVFAPLHRFLQDDADYRKRYQLAERLADLFDQYQVYRADWLAAWAEGRDEIVSLRRGRVALDPAVRWQPAPPPGPRGPPRGPVEPVPGGPVRQPPGPPVAAVGGGLRRAPTAGGGAPRRGRAAPR
ncbi:exodeoxyribonuclease V subunit gamma, partial [Zobellella denitrificans]|uniref:exodeoxyribonuclease V subunit gamma n=1 Tax=Zobellella denitrificans TaxID=347534 RepID=UPI00115D7110